MSYMCALEAVKRFKSLCPALSHWRQFHNARNRVLDEQSVQLLNIQVSPPTGPKLWPLGDHDEPRMTPYLFGDSLFSSSTTVGFKCSC